MKISKLHIDQFRHLENLTFDFTYQSGERKGQPLDKICFIGQSATGKTGILELLYQNISNILNYNIKESFLLENSKLFDGKIDILINENTLSIEKNEIFYDNKKYVFGDVKDNVTNLIHEIISGNTFFFQANLISEKNIEIFKTNPIDLNEKYHEQIQNLEKYHFKTGILFNDNLSPDIWLFILTEILNYRKNFTQKISELINNQDLNKFTLEFQKWQQENPNALESFAKELNPLLEKLNLEVDLINTEYCIPIKNKRTNEIIPIQNTSTGTKGLLLSFLPLFKLDTKDSIILIDEPERSLYPDMQMDLMDNYKKLAPDAQFIVATHSPFIAASFEPDERFILYFDKEGKVDVRRGTSPIGDDPNDMLKNDFGLEFLMNKKGIAAFERFKKLKKCIASEKDETKKDVLLKEILELANDYKF